MSDHADQSAKDPQAQIAELRDQVQSLVNDRVAPAMSQAADTARQYAHDARDAYDQQARVLSEKVRETPVLAVLLATGVGYVIGRIAR